MLFAHGKTLIKIAVADDHTMLREAICTLINDWESCKVILQAGNGRELIEQLDPQNLPDLVITDLSMPEMNGYETIKAVKAIYPAIKFLVVSMYYSEESLMQLVNFGAEGFIAKNGDSGHLKKAVFGMMCNGYYFTDHATGRLVKKAIEKETLTASVYLSDKELTFLKYAVTEKTYPQIAKEMGIPPRQVEYLRKILFEKFEVQSRTGLAVQALGKGLIL